MTETPCTMTGGPLDGELRVVGDDVLAMSRPLKRQWRSDESKPQWAGYKRTGEDAFAFIGFAVSVGDALFLNARGDA